MNKKKVFLAAGIITALAALSAVIITLGLHGAQLSSPDAEIQRPVGQIMFFELIVFTAGLVAALYFGNKLISEGRESRSAQEKAIARRGVWVTITGILIACALTIAGALLRRDVYFGEKPIFASLIISAAIPLLMLCASKLAAWLIVKRLNAMRVEEGMKLLDEKRELAAETAASSGLKLRRLRLLNFCMAAVMLLCGVVVGLANGASGSRLGYIPFLVVCAAYIIIGLMRILPFKTPTAFIKEEPTLASRSEFPKLYGLAEEAAAYAGCKEDLRLFITPNGSVSVGLFGNTITLTLGVFILNVLSEEELKSVLRHEFSHITAERGDRELAYNDRMLYAMPRHLFSWLQDLIFIYPDSAYFLEYMLNDHANSVIKEEAADRAMTDGISRETAASALTKVNYYSLYMFEQGGREGLTVYKEEEAPKDEISRSVEDFKACIDKRAAFWDELAEKELISRSASHPILKMRLEQLGVEKAAALPFAGSAEYVEEVGRATSKADSFAYELRRMDFEDMHRERYLEPLETIEKWRGEGEPIAPETYRTIVDAMQTVSMYSEADALCKRVIEELPEPASPYAHYVLGYNAVRRYDDDGIEHLFKAAEESNNLYEAAMDQVGLYCCMTGNEEQLERYRREVTDLAQHDKDIGSELGVLRRSDRLSAERLPDGVLEETLNYIHSVESGEIERIFLVHKTITEEFFTSAFVIDFAKGAPRRVKDEIMDKIFLYLDTTTDWQYSLFLYEDVSRAGIDKIEGTLVYSKEEKLRQ